jgi:hypothetical protein
MEDYFPFYDRIFMIFAEDCVRLDDHAVMAIAGLKHVESLDLNNTAITDDGLTSVATLTDLSLLDLEGTKITDSGLLKLRRLKNLGVLNVEKTGITDAGKKSFKEAMPYCAISPDYNPLLRWDGVNFPTLKAYLLHQSNDAAAKSLQ